jgi:predicted metal-dependent peptidase
MFADYRFELRGDAPVTTDGKRIYIDPGSFEQWGQEDRCYMVLHALLHAALLHPSRRGLRQPELWNLAADIVVDNAIAEAQSFSPSVETFVDERFFDCSAEQIYARLQNEESDCVKGRRSTAGRPTRSDLLEPHEPETGEDGPRCQEPGARKQETQIRQHWEHAIRRARTATRLRAGNYDEGLVPDSLDREIHVLTTPQLDWRSILWRFVTRTPCDFQGFDRRFLWQGLYLDALDGESVRLHVAIDTSGSIGDEQLQRFVAEIDAMLRSYPHIECWVSSIDTELHGPLKVSGDISAIPLEGGGGTDFRPFFEMLAEDRDPAQTLCVFLTDGFGVFPDKAPSVPVLWVVTESGLDEHRFPFGEVVRL